MIPILLRVIVGKKFEKGPINMGPLSIPLGKSILVPLSSSCLLTTFLAITAVVWLFVTSIFFLLPSEYPVASDNMNYAWYTLCV